MDEKTFFLKSWEKEAPATRKVLSHIPEGSTYKPDPKSRTARARSDCRSRLISLDFARRGSRRKSHSQVLEDATCHGGIFDGGVTVAQASERDADVVVDVEACHAGIHAG